MRLADEDSLRSIESSSGVWSAALTGLDLVSYMA